MYSTPDHTGPAAVDRLAAAGLVTSGVCLGVTALLVSWFLNHRSVRRAAITAQRRRTGSAAHQARRRPPVAVRAGCGYIPRGAVVHRETALTPVGGDLLGHMPVSNEVLTAASRTAEGDRWPAMVRQGWRR